MGKVQPMSHPLTVGPHSGNVIMRDMGHYRSHPPMDMGHMSMHQQGTPPPNTPPIQQQMMLDRSNSMKHYGMFFFRNYSSLHDFSSKMPHGWKHSVIFFHMKKTIYKMHNSYF